MKRDYESEAMELLEAVDKSRHDTVGMKKAAKWYKQNPKPTLKQFEKFEQETWVDLIKSYEEDKQRFGKKLLDLILKDEEKRMREELAQCKRMPPNEVRLLTKKLPRGSSKRLVSEVAKLLKQGKLKPLQK